MPGTWPASLCSRWSRMTWRKEWAYVWIDTDSSCRMVKNDTAAVNCISTPATCRASCIIRKNLLLHRWEIRNYFFLIQGHRNQTQSYSTKELPMTLKEMYFLLLLKKSLLICSWLFNSLDHIKLKHLRNLWKIIPLLYCIKNY